MLGPSRSDADEILTMHKFFHRSLNWLAPLALVGILSAVATACPTCKEGLAQNDPQYQSVAEGFFYSILFMMSMPYLILGSFGYLAFVSIRRAKAGLAEGTGDGMQGTGSAV